MRGSRRKTYEASISDLNPGRINRVHRVFWLFGQPEVTNQKARRLWVQDCGYVGGLQELSTIRHP